MTGLIAGLDAPSLARAKHCSRHQVIGFPQRF